MKQKTNFYIFEKKEIFLVFLFILLSSLIAFMLGVKFGTSYYLADEKESADIQQKVVNMMSQDEEDMEDALSHVEERGSSFGTRRKQIDDVLQEKIERELEKIEPEEKENSFETKLIAPTQFAMDSNSRRGKYTIQLGSFRTREEADDFAAGFIVKGHEPIITQVELVGRGVWFRVSLGEFNSAVEAKNYVEQERELFLGQDYLFGQF